ncbi:hypothetical protein F442_22333, partial [Phytophthora nicotianae P10297]
NLCTEAQQHVDCVHLDEKWFYLREEKQRFYLGEDEYVHHIPVKNNNLIIKVMLFAAVARPRSDAKRHCVRDGNIDLWLFVVHEPAERSSKNRPARTLELKTFTTDRDVYRRALCRMVIPCNKAV